MRYLSLLLTLLLRIDLVSAEVPPVDVNDMKAVQAHYFNYHCPVDRIDVGWSGSLPLNDRGAVNEDYRSAVEDRLNFYRTLAGLPGNVLLKADLNDKAQTAALVVAQNGLTDFLTLHDITYRVKSNEDPYKILRLYTPEVRETILNGVAVGGSDIAWGLPYVMTNNSLNTLNSLTSVPGRYNTFAHKRRTLLSPSLQHIGIGAVLPERPTYYDTGEKYSATASAFHVGGGVISVGLAPTPHSGESLAPILWPPAGFVPYELIGNNWTIRVPGADMSGAYAEIRMTSPSSRQIDFGYISESDGYHGKSGLNDTPGDSLNLRIDDIQGLGRPFDRIDIAVFIGNIKLAGQTTQLSYTIRQFDPDPELNEDLFDVQIAPRSSTSEYEFLRGKLISKNGCLRRLSTENGSSTAYPGGHGIIQLRYEPSPNASFGETPPYDEWLNYAVSNNGYSTINREFRFLKGSRGTNKLQRGYYKLVHVGGYVKGGIGYTQDYAFSETLEYSPENGFRFLHGQFVPVVDDSLPEYPKAVASPIATPFPAPTPGDMRNVILLSPKNGAKVKKKLAIKAHLLGSKEFRAATVQLGKGGKRKITKLKNGVLKASVPTDGISVGKSVVTIVVSFTDGSKVKQRVQIVKGR